MIGTEDKSSKIRIEGDGKRWILLPRGMTMEEQKTCAMCNRLFPHGEPEYLWLGHEFCSDGCREEFIQIVSV